MTTSRIQIVFIDHYDSFSCNVLDWLERANVHQFEITRVFCDQLNNHKNVFESPNSLPVFGPGPGSPKDYPETMTLIQKFLDARPMLGVCLGHQMFGYADGANIIKAKDPWHGRLQNVSIKNQSKMYPEGQKVFSATFYNSLVVDEVTLSKRWEVTAYNDSIEIASMSRKSNSLNPPTWSYQFHPESFLTPSGHRFVEQWYGKVLSYLAH